MAELIDKWKVVDMLTALENEFQHYKPFHGFEHAMYRKVVEVEMEIGKMVAVEAEPVVHAHWIEHEDELGLSVECSGCHTENVGKFPRCPVCGAYMSPCYQKCVYAQMVAKKYARLFTPDNCDVHQDEMCPYLDEEESDE